MKTLVLALVLSLASTSAFAGSANQEAKIQMRIYELVAERNPEDLDSLQPGTNLVYIFGNTMQLGMGLEKTLGIDGPSLGRYIDGYCRENKEGPFGVIVRGSVNTTMDCVIRAVSSYKKEARSR